MHPSSLYALARSGFNVSATNVVRSRDAGLTWEELSTGLQGWNLDSLTIDPVTPNRLLVSAAGAESLPTTSRTGTVRCECDGALHYGRPLQGRESVA